MDWTRSNSRKPTTLLPLSQEDGTYLPTVLDFTT